MDITSANFKSELLGIIQVISRADYLAIDCEMSGVPPHLGGETKPLLQEHYQQMKLAADKYQMLQFGISCMERVDDKDFYMARAYNFYINPTVFDRLGKRFDRIYSMSSKACSFLSTQGMDFGKIFRDGIRYLSKHEEDAILQDRRDEKSEMDNKPDLEFGPHDVDALRFYRWVEEEVRNWINQKAPKKTESLNIEQPSGIELSSTQRRAVHEICKKNGPYKAVARSGGIFMQITELKEGEERFNTKGRDWHRANELMNQKALNWILEAITSDGDLRNLDPSWLTDPYSENVEHQLPHIKVQIRHLQKALHSKPRIIVGHNVFTDLGFVYKTLVGPLPNRVDQFQREIHAKFPYVIDTKFMATAKDNSLAPTSQLGKLLGPYSLIYAPLLCLHEKFTSYGPGCTKEHEAGFDSWKTAELFIKMTADFFSQTPEGEQALVREIEEKQEKVEKEAREQEMKIKKNRKKNKAMNAKSLPNSKSSTPVATSNPFAALSTPTGSGSNSPDRPSTANSSADNTTPAEILALQLNNNGLPNTTIGGRKVPQWLPPIGSPFWTRYMDKLRINHCQVDFIDLSNPVETVEEGLIGMATDGAAGEEDDVTPKPDREGESDRSEEGHRVYYDAEDTIADEAEDDPEIANDDADEDGFGEDAEELDTDSDTGRVRRGLSRCSLL